MNLESLIYIFVLGFLTSNTSCYNEGNRCVARVPQPTYLVRWRSHGCMIT
ncbi:hypothetical protein FDUTEX481_03344 [Tolypothrix sp. PCC 7601]|nr:hypothetical protein FDUTEX481_03344 [Tolypothrix sp. PCC 7601]